eukprot:COSAG02_NODE_29011_length_577_cov_1.395397_1_plen_25_part_10
MGRSPRRNDDEDDRPSLLRSTREGT